MTEGIKVPSVVHTCIQELQFWRWHVSAWLIPLVKKLIKTLLNPWCHELNHMWFTKETKSSQTWTLSLKTVKTHEQKTVHMVRIVVMLHHETVITSCMHDHDEQLPWLSKQTLLHDVVSSSTVVSGVSTFSRVAHGVWCLPPPGGRASQQSSGSLW